MIKVVNFVGERGAKLNYRDVVEIVSAAVVFFFLFITWELFFFVSLPFFLRR